MEVSRFQVRRRRAQMAVYNVDGDGLNDVITSWHCHHYGLVWYQQQRGPSGEITWKQHVILPPKPDLKSDALRISQMHSLDLADMKGDGTKGIVTGKRYWAHGPNGDVEPDAPAVLYWFELKRDKAAGAASFRTRSTTTRASAHRSSRAISTATACRILWWGIRRGYSCF